MSNKTIPILVETPYHSTKWCNNVLLAARHEAARYGYSLEVKDNNEINCFFRENDFDFIMVLGTDIVWIKEAIQNIKKQRLRVMLICAEPVEFCEDICAITPDRGGMMIESIRYLSCARRTRIALFGFNNNATSDILRQEVFLKKCNEFGINASESDVYINNGSVKECFEKFIVNAEKYNAVICANDAAAVYLMKEIAPYHITIPKNLFVIGNGNTIMGKMVVPSLTSITLNYEEVGRHAVQLYRYLSNQSSLYSINATITCEIIARESTDFFKKDKPDNDIYFSRETKDRFFLDPDIQKLLMLDILLSDCDEIDFKIIRGLMEKTCYETLADKLYISLSTLKYRLKKLYSTVEVNSAKEFLSLIDDYNIKI